MLQNGNVRNNAGQNNAGNAVQNPAQRQRLPHPPNSLAVHNGSIASFRSSYKFGAQAFEALNGYFDYLRGPTPDRRLLLNGPEAYKDHPHPVGATMRALLDDKIIYIHAGCLPQRTAPTILDIGSSPVRAYSRYESGFSVMDRMRLMTPNLGVRDDLRVVTNTTPIARIRAEHERIENTWPEVDRRQIPIDHECHHKGAGGVRAGADICANCARGGCEVIKSVDSAYYPGVLEEVFEQLVAGSTIGYVVMNDYHHAMLRLLERSNGFFSYGEALPNREGVPESTFTVDGDSALVTCAVQGNILPYEHQIFKTNGKTNFAYKYTPVTAPNAEPKPYLFIFEQIDCFWNKDIPYKMWRVMKTEYSRATLKELEILEITGPWWLTSEDIDSLAIRKCKIQCELADEELRVSNLLTKANMLDDAPMEGIDEHVASTTCSTDTQTESIIDSFPPDIFKCEEYAQKLVKAKDMIVDLEARRQRAAYESSFLNFVRLQFDSSEQTFRLRYKDGELYMLVSRVTRCFFGLIRITSKSSTSMAKVSDVLKAYLKVGNKTQLNSIMFSMVSAQRDSEVKDLELFNTSEAYTIAMIVRAAELKRIGQITAGMKA